MAREVTVRDVVDALKHEDPDVARLLREFIEASADPDALLYPGGPSLLRMAVEHLCLEAIEELAKLGANLDMRSGREALTALHHAVDIDIDSVIQATPNRELIEPQMFKFNVTRLLLRLGASPGVTDAKGETARELAARYQLGRHFDEVVAAP